MGRTGHGTEWLGREHGIFVDANDFVWIGGARRLAACNHAGRERRHDHEVHDDRRARYADRPSRTEHGQSRYGERPSGHRRRSPTRRLRRSTSRTATATSASSCSTGDRKFKRMWGAFGNPPPATFAPNAPAPQPQTTPDGPPEFGLPHAIKVSQDGVVYLADRMNNRIQMFTREGEFLKQVRVTNEGSTVVPVPAGFAFSPDRNQRFLYVVDSGPMRVVIFDRQTMTQIGVVGTRARTPASSTSCTTWRSTRRGISTRRRSSTTGARRSLCWQERREAIPTRAIVPSPTPVPLAERYGPAATKWKGLD